MSIKFNLHSYNADIWIWVSLPLMSIRIQKCPTFLSWERLQR